MASAVCTATSPPARFLARRVCVTPRPSPLSNLTAAYELIARAGLTHARPPYGIDSVTVGSGPRDNKQFDSVQLGSGPAIRAWDATTMLPEASFRAALARAEQIGVPLQYGYMQGGNDASVFEPSGARVLGLGVPLAYSHSNVERIHMGDLEQLVELLVGWCTTD